MGQNSAQKVLNVTLTQPSEKNSDRKPLEIVKEFCSKDDRTCRHILQLINFRERQDLAMHIPENTLAPLARLELKDEKVADLPLSDMLEISCGAIEPLVREEKNNPDNK